MPVTCQIQFSKVWAPSGPAAYIARLSQNTEIIEILGLDGNGVFAYDFDFHFVNDSGGPSIVVFNANGDNVANFDTVLTYGLDDDTTHCTSFSGGVLFGNISNGDHVSISFHSHLLQAVPNTIGHRHFMYNISLREAGMGLKGIGQGDISWANTIDNLTKITLIGQAAGTFKAGSTVAVNWHDNAPIVHSC